MVRFMEKKWQKTFEKLIRLWEIDVIVPFLFTSKKTEKRGALIRQKFWPKEIGLRTGLPVDTILVKKKKYSASKRVFKKREKEKPEKCF